MYSFVSSAFLTDSTVTLRGGHVERAVGGGKLPGVGGFGLWQQGCIELRAAPGGIRVLPGAAMRNERVLDVVDAHDRLVRLVRPGVRHVGVAAARAANQAHAQRILLVGKSVLGIVEQGDAVIAGLVADVRPALPGHFKLGAIGDFPRPRRRRRGERRGPSFNV